MWPATEEQIGASRSQVETSTAVCRAGWSWSAVPAWRRRSRAWPAWSAPATRAQKVGQSVAVPSRAP